MKKANLNKLLIFGTLLLVSVAQSWANSYYAKMIARVSTGGSTGKGTVYVSNRNNSSSTSYGSTSELTIETNSSGGNCTFYLFAQPSDGYELAWWSTTDEGGNDGGVATNGAITVKASTNEDGTIEYTRYAVFKALPTFYFSATANVGSAGGGAASVTPTTTSAYGQHWNSESANATATFTATPNSGYEFYGWSNTADGTIVSSNNPYNATITSNSKSNASPTNTTLYAVFQPLPTFYFSATAIVSPVGAGVATATLDVASKYGDHWNSTSATTTATYSVTSTAAGYKFLGWSETADGAIVSEEQTYSKSVTSTSTNSGSPTNSTMYARFVSDPIGISVTPSSLVLNVGETGTISVTLEPNPSYRNIKYTSTNTGIATVTSEGIVTGVSVGETTITVQAVKIDNSEPESLRKTVAVTVKDKCATPTISFSDITNDGAKATLSSATADATIYYTINGSVPTASSTPYTAPFAVESGDVVRAIAIVTGTDEACWSPSDVLIKTYKTSKVATPSIVIGGDGTISFTCSEEGTVTYKYCISDDGDCTPTTEWNGTPIAKNLANNEKIITVIASKDGCVDSDPATKQYTASGISGTTVILNDYEDHNWTYYQKSDNLPAGYPTGYLNSPDPRNVKITYRGGGVEGASAVAISGLEGEGQNTMVYYKTLEKHDLSVKDDGEYAYTVISNPFSKRPRTTGSTGTDGYYGFAGWKIISGAEYIQRATGKATPTNNTTVLDLDETIHFVNLDNDYTPNCTSAEVVFEATWTLAQVKTGTSVPSFDSGYTTYETRFWVISGNITGNGALSIGTACTMMAKNPDGTTGGYNSYTIQRAITAGTDNVKIEWVKFNSTGAVDANGKTFTIGRGVVQNGTGGPLYGINTDANCVNTIKIESGKYSLLHNFNSGNSNGRSVDQLMILGCDYDRAKNDNDHLSITGEMYVGKSINLHRTSGELFCRAVIKSGNFQPGVNAQGSEYTGVGGSHTYYMSVNGTAYPGRRYMLVEGGHHRGLNGGMDEASGQSTTDRAFDLRVRGTAQIDGVVYGGAEYANAKGTRTMIFTGGTINGWVAGGANGTQSTNGKLSGSTYLYIGGKTSVDSRHSTKVMNRSVGGNVYGAGCGYSGTSSSGEVTLGTNIVVADNAFVERGVYGGGGFGFSSTGQTSNIYITGGHIGGYTGTDSGNTTIHGGVYGGARQNDGGSSNIIMTGGLVEGGLYGGSNSSGTLSGNVTMQINGGQVGTTTASANIHGGGYGQNTSVSGDVNVTLGSRDTSTGVTSGTAVVYGDVYGGSALGSVNGTSANTDYHTNVTLNAGTIHGSIYGGALGATGTAANVYGPVAVKVYGGSVMTTDGTGANGSGAVYGANNINGAPQRSVTVDIYGTDEAQEEGEYALFAVYGGGNHANYTYTEAGKIYPQVTIHNCDNSIEYVYGGGNQATVPGTQVKVYGGNVIGNVFGGGNNADVTNNTTVDIYGGTILNVFGGNNNDGTVGGTITVTVDAQAEGTGTACTMAVGNVYGGGNIADYTGSPVVNFLNGTSTGSVFGGGKGKEAVVVGNPVVNIGDWNDDHSANIGGNVFGGGDLAAVEGNPTVTIRDCGTTIGGDLYGGGNAAPVYSTNTTMWGGTVKGNVFGGGNGSDATKNPNGAQVGYNRDDTTAGTGDGNAVTNIYGGTVGTWTTVSGVQTCTAGGGVFGGSNTNGNIRGAVTLTMDAKASTETDAEQCDLKVFEVYGAGNEAPFAGAGVTLSLGCITSMDEIYGGAKKADMKGDVDLKITSGHFGKVFGGNNISGKLDGKIVVTIDETACNPVTIGTLYGGGNLAAYSVYGYNDDGTVKTSGDKLYNDPVVNVVSCTSIGTIFGGGKGESAKVVGSPTVNVNLIPGVHAADIDADGDSNADNDANAIGTIGTIYGGGDAAPVVGNTLVNIGTATADQHHVTGTDLTTTYPVSVNITGNVFGAGYGTTAAVSGNAKVVIGPEKTTVTP